MKELYLVKHCYDVDGGFGDAVAVEDVIGIVECTKEEIDKFIKDFDKSEVYDTPYSDLYHHGIEVEAVHIMTISDIRKDPYKSNLSGLELYHTPILWGTLFSD